VRPDERAIRSWPRGFESARRGRTLAPPMPSPATPDRSKLEGQIAAAFAAGDRTGAVTLLLGSYGQELSRFLAGMQRSEEDADEAFSAFTEALWTASAAFEGRSSARTWAYAIARRVALRQRMRDQRLRRRFQPLPEDSELSALEARLRSDTLSFLRTERRSKFVALREALPEEDQMLLVLRVDRRLPWNDLAVILRDEQGGPLDDEGLRREAARLRKRFQALKEKLRTLGRREGLLGGGDGGP